MCQSSSRFPGWLPSNQQDHMWELMWEVGTWYFPLTRSHVGPTCCQLGRLYLFILQRVHFPFFVVVAKEKNTQSPSCFWCLGIHLNRHLH